MADYHPVDVRYKGPSTSYRGSVHKRDMSAPDPAAQPAKKPAKPARKSAAPADPWGTKSNNQTLPAAAVDASAWEPSAVSAPASPPRGKPTLMGMLIALLLKLAFSKWGLWIGLVLYVTYFMK